MFGEMEIRDILIGRRRGLFPAAVRTILACLEPGYALAVAWRNRRFDRQRALVHRVAVPVISVGNLTVGGTGKTPMVAWLARWFRQRGLRVALVSRGYRAEAGARNDEALELERQLPDVPHLLNADRVAAARTAIEEFETELIILDDAFQHRRIARDLDIVLIDALDPFGSSHLLPRGLLREPLSSLKRADMVVLTRRDLVPPEERQRVREELARFLPTACWAEAVHRPQSLLTWPDSVRALDALANAPVAGFCGIGNSEGFRQTLMSSGMQLLGFRPFPDHHAYGRKDLDSLSEWAVRIGAAALVCTQKDLVKIQVSQLNQVPLYGLLAGMEIVMGRELIESALLHLLQSAQARAR